jgi:hypothetical protein
MYKTSGQEYQMHDPYSEYIMVQTPIFTQQSMKRQYLTYCHEFRTQSAPLYNYAFLNHW